MTTDPKASPAVPRATSRARTPLLVVASAVVVIVGVIILRLLVRPTIDASNRTIVVMPFELLGTPSDRYFADAMSDEITAQLARLPGVKVLGREGVSGATVAQMRPQELASTLGAQYVLSGTVKWTRRGTDSLDRDAVVELVPVLTEASVGERVWSESMTRTLAELSSLESNVVNRVARELSVDVPPVPSRTTVETTVADSQGSASRARDLRARDLRARDLRARGRAAMRQNTLPELRNARTLFAQAIVSDSSQAAAWTGLAESDARLASFLDSTSAARRVRDSALTAAQRAFALDSNASDTRVVVARLLAGQLHLSEAMANVDRAIATDSAFSAAWLLKGDLLTALDKLTEAGEAYRSAQQFDRLAPSVHYARAIWFLNAHFSDSAATSVERALALAPADARWALSAILVYAAVSRTNDATHLCSAIEPADLCNALARALSTDSLARPSVLARLKRQSLIPHAPALMALVRARLGDADGAFTELQNAVASRDSQLLTTLANPWLDMLHTDARWTGIVASVRTSAPSTTVTTPK